MNSQPFVIENGWLSPAQACPSPNFNQRPEHATVRLIVIHNISLPPRQYGGGYVQQFFLNRLDASVHPYFETIKDLKVSSHLLIERSGQIFQFVSMNDRAWHAGQSTYLGVEQCNDYSIGIELEGADGETYTDAQYEVLPLIVAAIYQAYPQTHRHLTGHSDIAPQRKTDPSPSFDWQRFRTAINQVLLPHTYE